MIIKRCCKAKIQNGQPCPNRGVGESGYCFTHDPARGRERAEARKRGGERHRIPHNGDASTLPTKVRTLQDVLALLDYTLAEALPLENSVIRGRLLITLATAYTEALRVGEFEARLTALEQVVPSLPNASPPQPHAVSKRPLAA